MVTSNKNIKVTNDMKTIKYISLLFIALVAMSSCSNDDNTVDTPDVIPVDVDGIWYAEVPMTGITYDMRSGDDLREVTYDHIGIKLTLTDSIGGWTHYYIVDGDMVNYEGGYDNLFGYTVDKDGNILVSSLAEGDDISFVEGLSLYYSNGHIMANGNGLNLVFNHPDTEVESKLEQWDAVIDEDHMGLEADEIETDLNPNNADEPSRARRK